MLTRRNLLTGAAALAAYARLSDADAVTPQQRAILLSGGFAAKLASALRSVYLAAEGDSITTGSGAISYADRFNTAQPTLRSFLNNAVSGSTISVSQSGSATLASRAATLDATEGAGGATKNLLSVLAGINDFYYGRTTDQVITNMTAYLDARRTAGWKVVLNTLLPENNAGTAANVDQSRDVANIVFRTWPTKHCDYISDFAANPIMGPDGAWSNATYYQAANLIHPTNAGQAILAQIFTLAIGNYLISGSPPAVPAVADMFDPAIMPTNKALSAATSYRTITSTGAGAGTARGVAHKSGGKYHIEFVLNVVNGGDIGVGLINAGTGSSGILGLAAGTFAIFASDGNLYIASGTPTANMFAPAVSGDVIVLEIDEDTNTVSAAKNAAISGGSQSFAAISASAPFNLGVYLDEGEGVTLRTQASSWQYTPTSGFGEWLIN